MKYSCLSNFYKKSMKIDNKEYKTVEHYYQSQKFLDNLDI